MASTHVLPPDSLGAPRTAWDLAAEILLGLLLVFTPAAFGAVEEWSELVVVALSAALVLLTAVRAAVDRTFRPPWTWLYAPLALVLALAVLQATPWPRAVVAALSPGTEALRRELGVDLSADAYATISVYPYATRQSLRLLLAGAAIFLATVATFRTTPQIKRLLLLVLAVGCAEAALALLQIFTRTPLVYWLIDPGTRRNTSGSFVNYSNYCQFVNLSIGAGLGLLLVRWEEDRREAATGAYHGGAAWGDVTPSAGVLLGALALCGVSVFTSLSRNGAIALVAAGAAMGTALFVRGTLGWRGWVLALAPLAAGAGLLAFAFDAVLARMAALQNTDALADRWQLTLSTLRAWRSFPIWGTGFGTHQYVFPMFDATTSHMLAEHADNDYAQLLEEAGLVGAVALAAAAAIVAVLLYRLCRRGRTAASFAAFGLAYGLLAAAIQSGTDFGQRLPAVFGLTAVCIAVVVQLTRLEREATGPEATAAAVPGRGLAQRAIAATLALAATGVAAWSLHAAWGAFLGEQWWAMAYQIEQRLADAPDAEADEQYVDLIAASQKAFEIQDENVLYGYWLNVRRWTAVRQALGAALVERPLAEEVRTVVERIADELAAVRALCPTFGPPYALEGQLRRVVLGDRRGDALIDQGMRLAPYDPTTCLIAGEIAVSEGRAAAAAQLFERTVDLAPWYFSDVARQALLGLQDRELARRLAGDDVERLRQLAEMCAGRPELADFAATLARDAEQVLARRAQRADATAEELARLAAIRASQSQHGEAAALFRRALVKNYSQITWRLALARSLMAEKRFDDAEHEARICLRLAPEHAEAKRLLEELSILPGR